MARAHQAGAPWPGALAVSGGGDSLALMWLVAEWAAAEGQPPPTVLTVDHGLSPGSAKSARGVMEAARAAGLKAHILKWTGDKPQADIEAAARDARYRLMAGWCRRHGIFGLYLGHSIEDQAETFLLRLARGSGLDGLAAMQAVAPCPLSGAAEVRLVRPLLECSRAALRAELARRGIAWTEDPMNADPRFARVRLRAAWPALEAAGLGPARIAGAAGHLARARAALEIVTADFLTAHARIETDAAYVDAAALAAAPREIGLRALASLLGTVSGAQYRPRFERLERLFEAILTGGVGKGRTLQGCRIGSAPKRHALFGASTLKIALEAGRDGRQRGGMAPTNAFDQKSPQKGG
jgi:tRNA(Ile)-lysidine synthase